MNTTNAYDKTRLGTVFLITDGAVEKTSENDISDLSSRPEISKIQTYTFGKTMVCMV